MNTYKWTYETNHYNLISSKRKSIIINADTREDAIWTLYEIVIKNFGTHLYRFTEKDTFGFGWLFDPDVFCDKNYKDFDCYNLEKINKQDFIKVFEKQINDEDVEFSVNLKQV